MGVFRPSVCGDCGVFSSARLPSPQREMQPKEERVTTGRPASGEHYGAQCPVASIRHMPRSISSSKRTRSLISSACPLLRRGSIALPTPLGFACACPMPRTKRKLRHPAQSLTCVEFATLDSHQPGNGNYIALLHSPRQRHPAHNLENHPHGEHARAASERSDGIRPPTARSRAAASSTTPPSPRAASTWSSASVTTTTSSAPRNCSTTSSTRTSASSPTPK
jgi:hypothetical protein